MKWLLVFVSVFACVVGCGGSGGGSKQAALPEGYYKGTMTVLAADLFQGGTSPMATEILPNGDIRGFAYGEPMAQMSRQGSDCFLGLNQAIVPGGTVRTELDGDVLKLIYRLDGRDLVSCRMTKQDMPSLGSAVLIPPQSDYHGELVVVQNGHLAGYGGGTVHVDIDHNLTALTEYNDLSSQSYNFFGRFQPDGTLSNPLVIFGGSIFYLSEPIHYSYDGLNLVVEFADPNLGATYWLVYTRF